jgi:hypothetical protein
VVETTFSKYIEIYSRYNRKFIQIRACYKRFPLHTQDFVFEYAQAFVNITRFGALRLGNGSLQTFLPLYTL